VTFTPASATSFSATLSVADNAAGSPQTATLTGTGTAASATDYTVTSPAPLQSVPPGALAQFTINVAPVSGSYTSTVSFTVAGLPVGATASFNPATVVPGSTGSSTVMSIQTSPMVGRVIRPSSPHGPVELPLLAALLALPLLAGRRLRRSLAARPLLTLLLLLSGCGGGYFGPQSQSYAITVTGTSGSTQHSTTVTLNVQ